MPSTREEAGRDGSSPDSLRFVSSCDGKRRVLLGRQLGEASVLGTPVEVVGRLHRPLGQMLAWVAAPQHQHPVGIPKRERLEQHAIDESEDGRGCADRDRERQARCDREYRSTAQPTQRVLEFSHGGSHLTPGHIGEGTVRRTSAERKKPITDLGGANPVLSLILPLGPGVSSVRLRDIRSRCRRAMGGANVRQMRIRKGIDTIPG